jgi:hypothetical protein
MTRDQMPSQSDQASQDDVSRRHFVEKAVAALIVGGAISGCATGPAVSGTTPKADAQYQDRPSGLEKCSFCKHFHSPDICDVVAGPVNPQGWCRFYALF